MRTELADARAVSASPNVPVFAYEWRGALRGTLGAELPIRFGASPFAIVVAPFVDLHQREGSFSALPHDYWRGRLAIDVRWTAPIDGSSQFSAAIAFEHESDHPTALVGAQPQFLELNDVAVRVRWAVVALGVTWIVGGDAALLVRSCTRLESSCQGIARGGSTSAGAEATLTVMPESRVVDRIAPYASIAASAILARDEVGAEARLVGHVGASLATERDGIWAIYLLGWIGNEVGIPRENKVIRLGIGARWSF